MDVTQFLKEKSQRVEAALEQSLQELTFAPPGLVDAMRYSLTAGGKRLRPALVLGACELACGDEAPALPAACALEMIHTYSLIHDDLPAMDNDDFRRGKPTLHKQFGEATAILAGDALLTLAFYEAAKLGNAQVILELADAAGAGGMVGGQYLDMEAQGSSVSLNELQRLHSMKTGALIVVSLRIGALVGEASETMLEDLTHYGVLLGLLFQITDDILDVVGNAALVGKTLGKDAAVAKATYPSLVGLEQSRFLAEKAAEEAVATLKNLDSKADLFRALPHHILVRTH